MGLDGCILPRSQSVRLLSYPCSQEVSRRLICHPPRRFRRPNWIATCLGAAFNTCWGVQKLNTASIGAYTQLKPDSTSTPCSQGAGGGGLKRCSLQCTFGKTCSHRASESRISTILHQHRFPVPPGTPHPVPPSPRSALPPKGPRPTLCRSAEKNGFRTADSKQIHVQSPQKSYNPSRPQPRADPLTKKPRLEPIRSVESSPAHKSCSPQPAKS